MANLGGLFDASQVNPAEERTPVPAGKYSAVIIESGFKETSKGGQTLNLTMEIIDGEHKGRRVYDWLNLVNSNAQAVEIAQRTLSSICHAVGRLQVEDSEDLHHTPMLVSVKVRPARTDPITGKDYKASNEVAGYAALNGAMPASTPTHMAPQRSPVQATAPAATAPAGRAGGAAPPWLAKKTG